MIWSVKRADVERFLRGHAAAAERERALLVAEGPDIDRAIRHSLELYAIARAMGAREVDREAGDAAVRARWVLLKGRARA